MITIALPNYASTIAWLAMESLCRQKTPHQWELIVYEDSDLPLGEAFYNGYLPRLKRAGCIRLKYIYSLERVPLNQKWVTMAEVAHPQSLGLILQASDCYSEPNRINTAVQAFTGGADWIHSYQGCFYNIPTGQMMKYQKQPHKTGINISVSLRSVLAMPKDQDKWSSVDHWLCSNMPIDNKVYLDESEYWKGGVNTDGFNRISKKRHLYYSNQKPPFVHTYLDIHALLPVDVCEMLEALK